ncbi:hypothetical protein JTE90_027986 [Oedothorax gibbosus]|uniref:Uncharacterized protein n=1 Tax=Oedothorax gibbosus TaxID=931172 RepID=A0AAV6TGI5_9ARAC|nr:hypothetical protein JTE90_027986 [Oedothorax gibbosus]
MEQVTQRKRSNVIPQNRYILFLFFERGGEGRIITIHILQYVADNIRKQEPGYCTTKKSKQAKSFIVRRGTLQPKYMNTV